MASWSKRTAAQHAAICRTVTLRHLPSCWHTHSKSPRFIFSFPRASGTACSTLWWCPLQWNQLPTAQLSSFASKKMRPFIVRSLLPSPANTATNARRRGGTSAHPHLTEKEEEGGLQMTKFPKETKLFDSGTTRSNKSCSLRLY